MSRCLPPSDGPTGLAPWPHALNGDAVGPEQSDAFSVDTTAGGQPFPQPEAMLYEIQAR